MQGNKKRKYYRLLCILHPPQRGAHRLLGIGRRKSHRLPLPDRSRFLATPFLPRGAKLSNFRFCRRSWTVVHPPAWRHKPPTAPSGCRKHVQLETTVSPTLVLGIVPVEIRVHPTYPNGRERRSPVLHGPQVTPWAPAIHSSPLPRWRISLFHRQVFVEQNVVGKLVFPSLRGADS